MNNKTLGIASIILFLFSIPLANWWLDRYGFWDVPHLGPVASGVWVVGIAFVLRDFGQYVVGRRVAWAAIACGTILSVWLASPGLAVASGAAFLWSESTDALVFTPLANRGIGLFFAGLCLSGLAASMVDSALFVRIAFGSFSGWWQLTLVKDVFVLLAAPVVLAIRSRNALALRRRPAAA
jgi:uncharacterized PurR-regulated membrane protein YhhQ (DUF165 family)